MSYMRGAVTVVVLVFPIILLYKLWYERRRSEDINANNDNEHIIQLTDSSSVDDTSIVKLDATNPTSSFSSLELTDSTLEVDASFAEHDSLDLCSSFPSVEYEVFLSFRGPDTRRQITDILYRFLCRTKIHVFRDDNELRKGEEIGSNLRKAIDQSKIYVPIISKSYAHSKWCLIELAEIIQRNEQDTRRIILPIFYMVDPKDVRRQTGPYEDAFREHDKKYDERTIKNWKDALNKVGALKGWHVKNNDEQGAVADEVSADLLSRLSKENSTLETDELVGIDDHVEHVIEKLNLDFTKLTMVGLHGMGGIGKTTIAKAVYNKISSRFDRCCFVENIRETQTQKDGIVVLQKKLVSEILKMDSFEFANDSAGRKMIKERVARFKSLIILDDVDEKFSFQDILGSPEDFVSESRFIITSRNVNVLITLIENEYKLYEVGSLNHPHSLELFCKHAFRKNSPPLDYETLANDIVGTTGGLPLTLKVIGSLLYRQETAFWKDKLEQLRETLKLDQVMDRLKISYDTLSYDAQQIFLDIACFFIGTNKERPFYMWSDCKLYPMSNIYILMQRSMIKVGISDEFQMHDQLRDMGREIVRQEDVEHPWMRSRIWSAEEAIETLSNKMGSKHIKAIRVATTSSSSSSIVMDELRSEYFSNLSDLKYLDADDSTLAGDFNNLLPNLRWLRLKSQDNVEDRPLSNLTMNKLGTFGMLKDLLFLGLGYFGCDNLRQGLSDIGELPSLLVLRVYQAKDLLDGIKHPTSLKMLHTTSSICNLAEMLELEYLEMIDCVHGLEIPLAEQEEGEDDGTVWWKVSKLNKLKLFKTKIRRRSTSTSAQSKTLLPSSLTEFCVDGNIGPFETDDEEELVWIPSTLENLENLTRLSLSRCSNLREIQGIEGLKSLESLRINEVSGLTSIQHGLVHLIISSSSCSSCRLQDISITHCPDLTQLLSFDDDELDSVFNSLLQLHVKNCPRLDVAPLVRSLSKFPRLEVLNLDLSNDNAVEEKDMEALGSLEELKDLKLENFPPSIMRMPWLSKLQKLYTLEISGAENLQEIPELGELRSLTLLFCPSLERLWLADQHRLKSVFILCCNKLTANEKLVSELEASIPNAIIERVGMIYILGTSIAIVIIVLLCKLLWGRRRTFEYDPRRLETSNTTSASGDSGSVPLPVGDYEVFLSFRGPDTRHYFTDILYRFLGSLKIRTFKDDDELRKGEGIWPNLVEAISQSKIHVPIFSEGYAHSKWCLKELVEINERRKEDKGHVVLPIFCMMDPRDVRHQTGPYQSAFRQHKRNKVDEKIIQSWEDALNEIGSLKGWHVKSMEEVGAVVDEVSSSIWSHLSKDYTLDVDELVGIDNQVEAVIKKLSMNSENVKMLGIHGLGGIGKTTIAKVVHNKISYRFERHCFLENVRETLKQKDGIVVLQKKLIFDILRKDIEQPIDSNEGRKTIRERVSKFKLLVILDDVDESFKFEDILGSPENFVSGSTFLFTSRNIKVLSTLNEDKCMLYEVGAMNHESSLELLCKHAFKMDSPPADYKTLANNVVLTTGGLPLTLKVVGSLLYKEDVEFWKEKLEQLQGMPELQVMERLKISYDALQHDAQQIFLDVACFFIGEDVNKSSYLWSDCKHFPTTNIKSLVQRSMMEVGDDNKFQMHDQLRDMGREIVRQEDIEHPWMRSRIWSAEEAIETLSNKKGSKHVKAIRVATTSSSSSSIVMDELRSEYFSNFPNLKYLDTGSSTLTGDFSNLLPNLRWLRLKSQDNVGDRPLYNFTMNKMVILDLSECRLKNNWGGWSQMKTAGRLKHMDITAGRLKHRDNSRCRDLETIPYLPKSLEVLMLEDFNDNDPRKQEVLNIGELQKLKRLILERCEFKEIEGTFGMLKDLQWLDLTGFQCDNLRQGLSDIGELPSLEVLKTSIGGLDGIKHPTSLKILDTLYSVCNLTELLDLEELTMTACDRGLEIPLAGGEDDVAAWWKVSKLKKLDLVATKIRRRRSNGIESKTLLPTSLMKIYIFGLGSDEEDEESVWLPSTLENLENLTLLSVRGCSDLVEIKGIEGLKSLESLKLDRVSGLTSIQQGLEHLIISSSSRSTCKLNTLLIYECPDLTRVLSFNNDDTSLSTVVFDSLQRLEVQNCPRLDVASLLRSLSKFPRLGVLELDNLSNVAEEKDLQVLGSLEELEDLKLHKFRPSIKRMPSLSKLQKLSFLRISSAPSLQEIPELGELRSLTVWVCSSLERLWPAEQQPQPSWLKRLKSVQITNCSKLTANEKLISTLKAIVPNVNIR
ncbi:Disease resistance protein L6 [Linum perenne]